MPYFVKHLLKLHVHRVFTVYYNIFTIFYPWHSDHLYKTVSQNDDDGMLLKKARKYWLMLENFKAY